MGREGRARFCSGLKKQDRLYRKIEVKLLTDEDADNGSIIDGLFLVAAAGEARAM